MTFQLHRGVRRPRLRSRMLFRSAIAAVLLLTAASPALAQPAAPQPQPGVLVGQLQVTGASWSFSGSLPGLSGPFESATVTNTNCTRPLLPGSAQAGAVTFTTVLAPFD